LDAAPPSLPPAPPAIVVPAAPATSGAPVASSPVAGPATPAYGPVAAATDERPRDEVEKDLCARASDTDWLYLGATLAADVGSIWLDGTLKYNESRGVRYLGPAAVGLAWGWTLGGGYLALPKCSPNWVDSAPPEGQVRAAWPLALSLAGVAGIISPMIMGTEVGPIPRSWPVGERSVRVIIASASGVTGALLPYLLPPKTWRAARELEHLRACATEDGRGAFVSWAIRF